MTTTINGRTPEEIKKGLECCSVDGLSCSNCSYCVSCDADIHALERDALAYIQQLEFAQPKWISVEDELPPVGERVLALNGHSVFESFIDCQDVWHRSPTCYELKGNVTHWMPLPSTEGLE